MSGVLVLLTDETLRIASLSPASEVRMVVAAEDDSGEGREVGFKQLRTAAEPVSAGTPNGVKTRSVVPGER